MPGRLACIGVLIAHAALAQSQPPAATASHPFRGVTYVDRTDTSPRAVHLHVVQIDLRTPGLRFVLSPDAGRREVVRQTTRDFLAAVHGQIAINAHFFLPWPTQETDVRVIGLAAAGGRVYSRFEVPEQRYAIVADAPAFNIDRRNRASIVHVDPARADGVHIREVASLWTTLAGSAQIVTNGRITVPEYRDAAHPDGTLEPGGPNAYSNDKSWYAAVTARTAIGLSKDARTVTLFTVDARGGSLGLTVGEAATILTRDFGVWNALNLDGGGSTSMAMEEPSSHTFRLVNTSSDNINGRAVGSSLAVILPH